MNEIIKIKPEWQNVLRKHESKCNEFQKSIDYLTKNGLDVGINDIKDLVNHGTVLSKKVDMIVKSNAGLFKLPAARQKFIIENTDFLNEVVAEVKRNLFKILAIESQGFIIDAFEINEGIVSISEVWKKDLKESFTIYTTEKRNKALELIDRVNTAINELNGFVADNKFFGTGISSSEDVRRCLMYIYQDGTLKTDIDSIEFI